jgi:hypothetical protein
MSLRIAMPASLLAVFVVVMGSGAVSAAPRRSVSLTISATPNPIIAGEGVLVYGQLNSTDPANKQIVLHSQRVAGGTFAIAGTTFTNAEGFYEFIRADGIVMTTRSWYVTSPGPGAPRSRMVHESVAALLALAASATVSNTNRPLTFSGSITPNVHAGEKVFLQKQTGASGDSWSTIGQGVIATSSHYAITRSFLQPGTYVLRTMFRGDNHNATASSDPVSVLIDQTESPAFTINTSDPTIGTDKPVTISGVLYTPSSTRVPLPATSVTLWAHTAGRTYIRLGSTPTGSDGSYSFTQMPLHNETYQVRTTYIPPPRRKTAQVFEGVADVVSLTASSTTSMVGGEVTFTGTVSPDKTGHVIYLERSGADAHFHIVKTGFVATGSMYSFTWTFGAEGTKDFRVLVPGGEENLSGASLVVSVAVSGVAPVKSLPPAS